MNQMIAFFTLAVLVSQLHAAPQFITFKDGKLGVHFGGYHAGVAIGGSQGLMAEAGTPYGQHASAGLGGVMGGNGNAGGLFAGATAGNGINAAAGLGGSTNGQNAAGAGYASAQLGNRFAVAGLGGETSEHGSSGVKFAGTDAAAPTVVKETVPVVPVKPNVENEIEGFENVLPLSSGKVDVNLESRTNVVTPVEKEVRPADTVVEKVYYKERPHHHVYKAVGYLGANAEAGSDADVAATENVGSGGHVTVNKEVHFQRNPTFFSDIFNIPKTVLKSVGNLFGTTADKTKISVQKTASVSHEPELGLRSGYEPAPVSSGVSGGHQVTVESQQTASEFFDNIFNIPIHTLDAVQTFLDKNVPARKRIQVTQTGDHNIEASATAGLHLGPHARRRAAKRLLVVDTNKALSESQQ